jgi:hypothetical protein
MPRVCWGHLRFEEEEGERGKGVPLSFSGFARSSLRVFNEAALRSLLGDFGVTSEEALR